MVPPTNHLHLPYTHGATGNRNAKQRKLLQIIVLARRNFKKIHPPLPSPNSNKVAFFRLLISLFVVVVVVAFVVIFIRLLCLFSNSIISFCQRMLLHSNSNWARA